MLDEAERKHRQFFDLLTTPATRPVWEPPIDVFADETHVRVVVALPGARAEDVNVQITATGLAIDTHVSPAAAGLNVVRMEIPYGRMRRRVDLPPGRYALVERRLDHGCLYLRLTREGP
jgi:HSP20 family protein